MSSNKNHIKNLVNCNKRNFNVVKKNIMGVSRLTPSNTSVICSSKDKNLKDFSIRTNSSSSVTKSLSYSPKVNYSYLNFDCSGVTNILGNSKPLNDNVRSRSCNSSNSMKTISAKLELPKKTKRKPTECVPKNALGILPKSSSNNLLKRLLMPVNEAKTHSETSDLQFGSWIKSVPKSFDNNVNKIKPKSKFPQPRMDNSLLRRDYVEKSSKNLTDSGHEPSQREKKFCGPKWQKPCKHSFVAGAPRPYIGNCPVSIEKLAKFSKGRQKFFITQDPRKKLCLTNPATIEKKEYPAMKQNKILTNLVKYADNICTIEDSRSSESTICDEIDVDNPLALDYQGLDYFRNIAKDEQEFVNRWTYRRVRRVIDREKCQGEMKKKVESEQKAAIIKIPECFNIEDRNTIIKTASPIPPLRFAKLYRAQLKPHNAERLARFKKAREERYKNAIELSQIKEKLLADERQKASKIAEERLMTTLAEEDFEYLQEKVQEAAEFAYPVVPTFSYKNRKRKTFPHTIREVRHFKHKLKRQNHILKKTAILKRDFYREHLKKDKYYMDADIEFSEESDGISNEPILSEQSTDDEDLLKTEKTGNEMKLRGFHYKSGQGIRGKNVKLRTKQKGCITREEWLNELHPKKRYIRNDLQLGIQKNKDPNDKNLLLFNSTSKYKVEKPKFSAIRKFIEKRLGRQYDHDLRKNLRIVKPIPRFKVRKFNLVSFLQGRGSRHSTSISSNIHTSKKKEPVMDTIKYIDKFEREREEQKIAKKKSRMKLLGIPCIIREKTHMQQVCARQDNDIDMKWAPQLERMNFELERIQRLETGRISFHSRSNMPAPELRETTLCQHPRKPRKYSLERVPTELFNHAVENRHIPFIGSLEPDTIIPENVRLPKRPYTSKFKTRRHHDHWNPVQERYADVRYQPILAQPKINVVKEKTKKVKIPKFCTAKPKCSEYIDKDLTLPQINFDIDMGNRIESNTKVNLSGNRIQINNTCEEHDKKFHSRPKINLKEIEYPGRQEYLQFLKEIKDKLEQEKNLEKTDPNEIELLVKKEEMYKELEEDLKSIESCLSSFSSSEGTNFSNDSGSVLLLNDEWKLPMDYVRKQYVPFEEGDRSRFKVVPIDIYKENENPYRTLPFAGQKKAQSKLQYCSDGFHTFNSRINNSLRLRLEIPSENIKEKLLGCQKNKHYGRVITDVDKNYIKDLQRKPPIAQASFKTGATFIKDALRLKFECMVIQGEVVRAKIFNRINENNWNYMKNMKSLYEKLFAKWEKTEFEHAMSIVYQIKSFYEETDIFRKDYREVERDLLLLNMDIVFIEGHWIRCIMLQNFYYLLGDQDWRLENDWIHRIPGTDEDHIELESYDVSIAQRNTANIRVREKDDAWAIKTFYEEVYEKNQHEVLIVFPNAHSFLKGIENLKIKTFVLLLELHYTMALQAELQGRLQSFKEWCAKELKEKKEYVERKCSKKYFMEDRADDLRKYVLDFVDQPLADSFANSTFTRDHGLIEEVWCQVVPESSRGSTDIKSETTTMVAMIAEHVLDCLARFETMPFDEIHEIEADIRCEHARAVKISKKAYQIEKRIENDLKKVRRNLEPPFVKPKRTQKYTKQCLRSRIKPSSVRQKSISLQSKVFYRAFQDKGEELELDEARKSIVLVDKMQTQIVPFYFDHFLRIHGYTPNYNFRTQVDIRDGPETNFITHRELLPQLMEKIDTWEKRRSRIMEDNISRNPKMYENVK